MRLHLFSGAARIFNNLKMRNKLLLCFFCFIGFLLVTLFFVISAYSSSSLYEQITFSATRSFRQASAFLSYKMYKITGVSDVLVQDADLNTIISKPLADYPPADQVRDMQYIQRLLRSFQDEHDIRLVQLFVQDGLLYSNGNGNIGNMSTVQNAQWYQTLAANRSKMLLLPFEAVDDGTGAEPVVPLLRVLRNSFDYSSIAGFLRLDLQKSMLETILNDADPTGDSITFLFNSTGAVIAASRPEALAEYGIVNGSVPAQLFGEQYSQMKLGGKKVLAIGSAISGTDWTMATIVPDISFRKDAQSFTQVLLILMVAVALLACLLAFKIADTMTRRISKLSRRMQQLDGARPEPLEEAAYRDEVGVLYASYNDMVCRIDALIAQRVEMGRELKSAELKALQSQINPHFLYNTLDMVNWMSIQNRNEDISRTIKALAKFYKLSLNKGNDLVPLRDEVEHVRCYLEIQNLRFGNKIQFSLDIDPALLEYSIPKITLQPIVENAVYHGILEKPDKCGSVVLSAAAVAGGMEVRICDNGVGMPAQESSTPQKEGSRYGLRNIDQRIKLLFGTEYGVKLESEPGKGVCVTLLLPCTYVPEAQR